MAESKDEAVDRINAMGLLPVEVNETVQKEESKRSTIKFIFSKRIKPQDLTVFYGQLSKLVKSGMPILKALRVIIEQTDNANLHDLLDRTQKNVKEGKPLSLSLSNFPNVLAISSVSGGKFTDPSLACK